MLSNERAIGHLKITVQASLLKCTHVSRQNPWCFDVHPQLQRNGQLVLGLKMGGTCCTRFQSKSATNAPFPLGSSNQNEDQRAIDK